MKSLLSDFILELRLMKQLSSVRTSIRRGTLNSKTKFWIASRKCWGKSRAITWSTLIVVS